LRKKWYSASGKVPMGPERMISRRETLWHLIHLPAGIHAGGTADAGRLVVDHAVADPVDGLAVGEGGGKGGCWHEQPVIMMRAPALIPAMK
jgi:hypothetical protein